MDINNSGSSAKPLKPYEAPALVCFGDLSQLTASGSGAVVENGNPGNCSQNKSAKSCF